MGVWVIIIWWHPWGVELVLLLDLLMVPLLLCNLILERKRRPEDYFLIRCLTLTRMVNRASIVTIHLPG